MNGRIEDLEEERNDLKSYVEERKPYWMNLRHPRGQEMRFELDNYFPDAHYEKAIEQLTMDGRIDQDDLRPDGGRRNTQYYWSGEQGVLYHTETAEDRVDPFFNTIEEAERFLDNQAEKFGEEKYSSMVLRKSGNQKVEEATDVLTEQSGLTDW